MIHTPVLQKEVLRYLNPKPNQNFIDCTIGEGGHSAAILESIAPRGKVLGIDRDPEQTRILESGIRNKELRKRLIIVRDNFANLQSIVERHNFEPVHGVLFDLGFSSWHLEGSGRGFSFLRDEPLDMRYCALSDYKSQTRAQKLCPDHKQIQNPKTQNSKHLLTAEEIVNRWPERDIVKILVEYGEERFAKKIAAEIAKARKIKPVKTTFQLVDIIKNATPAWYHRGRIHPATRTFQALRIAVNDELVNLERALPQALDILQTEGRLVVISFHSLEDRLVKIFFRAEEKKRALKTLTKKPIVPSREELRQNPRSRSAKLRAAAKTIKLTINN